MGHKWIIDVLADLKSFAQENDLVRLAADLERTTNVAAAEIASVSTGEPPSAASGNEESVGYAHSQLGSGNRT